MTHLHSVLGENFALCKLMFNFNNLFISPKDCANYSKLCFSFCVDCFPRAYAGEQLLQGYTIMSVYIVRG